MKLFILLLPLVYARKKHDGIEIIIVPGPTEADTFISHKGEDIKVVTDSDATAFNLTKENLAEAVKVHSGESATDIFMKSPTPWGDLYKRYNWREVKREFVIKDIRLVNITIEESNIVEKIYRNSGNESKLIKANLLEGYEPFESRHYWSGNEKITAVLWYSLTRPYNPPLHYGYESKIGKDPFGSGVTVLSRIQRSAKFTLNPNETAKLYLKGDKVTVRTMVDYETNLIGDVVVNYENKHKGHHFWAYDVNKLILVTNLTATVRTSEYVEVFYIKDNIKTQVVDVSSGKDIEFTP